MADNKCSTPDCGGNCDTCNGDITVTLTLDNDETVECAILTIFPVDGRDYIALLLWMRTARMRTARYICTVTTTAPEARFWTISSPMRSTTQWLTCSIRCWTQPSTMS